MEQWYLYKKKANFNQIGEKFNIDPVIARLIRNRDVVGDEQIQQYLYGELSDISDPFLMKGVSFMESVHQHLRSCLKLHFVESDS